VETAWDGASRIDCAHSAAGGNVTGAMGQCAQAAAVTYLQTLGAEQIKALSPYLVEKVALGASAGVG